MKMTIEALGKMSHFVGTLHPQAIKEVLEEMNIESLRGFDLDLPAILDLFPPEKIIEIIGIGKSHPDRRIGKSSSSTLRLPIW